MVNYENYYIAVTADTLNINKDHNGELMKKCKVLADYSTLVYKIKTYLKAGMSTEDAVNRAVNECIEEKVLDDFLIKHKAEVLGMCLTEFNERLFIDTTREEGRIEGRSEGISLCAQNIVAKMRKKGASDAEIVESIMDICDMTKDEAVVYL